MIPPFDGLRPPRPDPRLRARVLAAAAGAASERSHWVDLLWESRVARLALALGLLLGIAANVPSLPRLGASRRAPGTIEIEGLPIPAERMEIARAILPEEIR